MAPSLEKAKVPSIYLSIYLQKRKARQKLQVHGELSLRSPKITCPPPPLFTQYGQTFSFSTSEYSQQDPSLQTFLQQIRSHRFLQSSPISHRKLHSQMCRANPLKVVGFLWSDIPCAVETCKSSANGAVEECERCVAVGTKKQA